MRVNFEAWLKETGLFVVDGSMSTALEQMGANLNCSLWTATALIRTPEMVKKVHMDYFKAGADCGITCSYQATIQGLTENGYSPEEAKNLIEKSVKIFQSAREMWWEEEGKAMKRAWPLCLAGIGPYGAYLADGSEYRGKYSVSDDELRDFHRERIQILWDAGADLLLFETQPSLSEALIEAEIAEGMNADYIVSFSCADGQKTFEGQPVRLCAEKLSQGHPHLRMLGINCTNPDYVCSLIYELRKSTSLPIIVYPNSGETYDPKTKTWNGQNSCKSFEDYALSYFKAGAVAVGGCCTTVTSHIEQVVRAKKQFQEMGCSKEVRL